MPGTNDIKAEVQRVIEVQQNETAWVPADKTSNIALLTKRLHGCVAVAFRDGVGNISLTHVDYRTDLSFMHQEARRMQGNYYKVTILRLRNHTDISVKVRDYVLSELVQPEMQKAERGEDNVIQIHGNISSTDTGIVWLTSKEIILTKTEKDLQEYSIETGRSDDVIKLQFLERMLESLLLASVRLPTVVFGGDKWLSLPTLAPSVAELLNKIPAEQKNPLSNANTSIQVIGDLSQLSQVLSTTNAPVSEYMQQLQERARLGFDEKDRAVEGNILLVDQLPLSILEYQKTVQALSTKATATNSTATSSDHREQKQPVPEQSSIQIVIEAQPQQKAPTGYAATFTAPKDVKGQPDESMPLIKNTSCCQLRCVIL